MLNEYARPGRLVIVANRLPFSASTERGSLVYAESPGGVASGLRTYLNSLGTARPDTPEYLWVGWPGSAIDSAFRSELRSVASADFHSFPVFLSGEEMEKFYHGFCNRTIWPLFHYFPTYAAFDEEEWRQYRHVNEVFCEAVLDSVQDGDVIWIHDYHLMLLPGLLRQRRRNLTIGFFLHIPFPSFEIFRLLPASWRQEILEGILGADLIGFHTYGYMQYFLQCVLRLLGHENTMGVIALPGRVIKAETFPMGIDFGKFHEAVLDPAVHAESEALRTTLHGLKIILSVDRLDYTKGVLNRLRGYELLLEENPGFRAGVVLVMVLVPSRIGVEQYEVMKKQIEELVGQINGKFGTVGWTPVIYQYRNLTFVPLAALYAVSDVCLVTPLRDGMNLVAKEYVASRRDGTGVLVLSEMAGAAKELGEAVIVNPHSTGEIERGLKDALEMTVEDQRRRNRILQNRLRRYDVTHWANEFVDQLLTQKQAQKKFEARLLPGSVRQEMLEGFNRASKRLILLDYDGTLTPIVSRPEAAKPGRQLLALLERLGQDPRTTVALISGRERKTIQNWFGSLPIHLVAEHGVWVREVGEEWKMLEEQRGDWKSRIIPIFERYMDLLPGAFVEEKEYSVAWHYRGAHPEQGKTLAGEMVDHLMSFTANIDLQVIQGKKVIEVRNAGNHKGKAGLHWLKKDQYDFIFAAGDDWTDEDLFSVLPDTAYSIRVGLVNSHARFNLIDSAEVFALLGFLAMQEPALQAQLP
jgi:trehalose 6-phosphate synthase/phosphatase